jgi:hypothetical protein
MTTSNGYLFKDHSFYIATTNGDFDSFHLAPE